MHWDILLSCSLKMWPQYLQSLFAQILGMERMSRMSCVLCCVCPWEASNQFGTKESFGQISNAKDQRESRRLFSPQRETEDFLSEWRRAHLPHLPNIKTAQSSWLLSCRGGGPTEKGKVKIETGEITGGFTYSTTQETGFNQFSDWIRSVSYIYCKLTKWSSR